MLSHCLELSRAGQPVWLPDMRAQCETLPDAVPVTMQLTLCDGRRRHSSLLQPTQGRPTSSNLALPKEIKRICQCMPNIFGHIEQTGTKKQLISSEQHD